MFDLMCLFSQDSTKPEFLFAEKATHREALDDEA